MIITVSSYCDRRSITVNGETGLSVSIEVAKNGGVLNSKNKWSLENICKE